MTPVEFFFDFASPYGYVASRFIEALSARHGRQVRWRPFLLGVAFKATGAEALVNYPLKGDYAVHDIARTCRMHQIKFSLPSGFPHAMLAPSRAFYWLHDQDEALAKRFAVAVYDAYFAEGRICSNLDVTSDVAVSLGVDREDILAAMKRLDIKERLKTETNIAIKRGVFGSPFFLVDGEPFWGADRLDHLELWLSGGGW